MASVIQILVVLAGSYFLSILLAKKAYRKYQAEWTKDWKVGDEAIVDTIGSGDIDLVKYHGQKLSVVGFSQDQRACFMVVREVSVTEYEEPSRNSAKVNTHLLLIPLSKLYHFDPKNRPDL
jgi:hypothetical protein